MEQASQRFFNCEQCGRKCKSERGIIQHLRYCTLTNENNPEVGQPPPATLPQRTSQEEEELQREKF